MDAAVLEPDDILASWDQQVLEEGSGHSVQFSYTVNISDL